MKKTFLLCALLFFSVRYFSQAQCPTIGPFITAVPNTIFPCHNGCNGMLVLDPQYLNGTPPYTFTSNFGIVVPDAPNPGWTSIINLCAGQLVIVNVTDAMGCTGMDGVTMIDAPELNPSISITPACGSVGEGSVRIGNIPDWFWQRSVTVNKTGMWAVFSGFYTPGDTMPLVLNNLMPGEYTFEMSFQMTDYYAPSWYGCTQTIPFTVPVATLPSALITPAGPTTFCSGSSVLLQAPAVSNRAYQWKRGGNLITGATSSSYTASTTGNYRVIVTNTITGCSKTSEHPAVVTVNALPAATITPQGPTTFCAGGSVLLKANTGTGLTHQWLKNATNIPGATGINYTATTAGTYKVRVTNSNGCKKFSSGVVVTVPCREGEELAAAAVPIAPEIDFSVFPNPNSGEFTIQFSNKPDVPVSIEMTDMMGKVIERFESGDEMITINESDLAEGIYSLVVRSSDKVLVKKIHVLK